MNKVVWNIDSRSQRLRWFPFQRPSRTQVKRSSPGGHNKQVCKQFLCPLATIFHFKQTWQETAANIGETGMKIEEILFGVELRPTRCQRADQWNKPTLAKLCGRQFCWWQRLQWFRLPARLVLFAIECEDPSWDATSGQYYQTYEQDIYNCTLQCTLQSRFTLYVHNFWNRQQESNAYVFGWCML